MTFDLEIMLRNDPRVFTERLEHPVDASRWTDGDAEQVLTTVMRAIERHVNPGGSEERPIVFRGITWIAHATPQGTVLALEIHSASAAAGPFGIDAEHLDAMLSRVVRSTTAIAERVH